MRTIHTTLLLAAVSFGAAPLASQAIIAQTQGLTNPGHVIDFGANLFPNFTPVSNQFPGIVITHARYFTTGVSNNLVGGFLTNDPIGLPNTLSIVFASPIQDLTFVYHQIGTSQPSVFRAMLGGVTVHSFSNSSNQSQPNNYFGFTGITFDELQLDFVGDFNVDTLAFNDAGATCTPRNGNGINQAIFTSSTTPILGQVWTSQIALNPNTITTFMAVAVGGAQVPPVPLFNGELLVRPTPYLVYLNDNLGNYSLAIPSAPSWDGFRLSTQGIRLQIVGPTIGVELTNALDLRLGL